MVGATCQYHVMGIWVLVIVEAIFRGISLLSDCWMIFFGLDNRSHRKSMAGPTFDKHVRMFMEISRFRP